MTLKPKVLGATLCVVMLSASVPVSAQTISTGPIPSTTSGSPRSVGTLSLDAPTARWDGPKEWRLAANENPAGALAAIDVLTATLPAGAHRMT